MSRFRAILKREEEGAMSLKLRKINIGIEEFNVIDNANDGCPEQGLGGGPGSLISQCQQPVQTMSDREYVILMEERYGIREEGIL
jgi:hypothetical protein